MFVLPRLFLVSFLLSGATCLEEKVLFTIGQILHVNHWLFERNHGLELLAMNMARHQQFTGVFDDLDSQNAEGPSTLVVVGSGVSMLRFIRRTNPPRCSWIVFDNCTNSVIQELPHLNSLIIFLHESNEGWNLMTIRRQCLGCDVKTKELFVSALNNSVFDVLSTYLYQNNGDFENAEINVSVNTKENCKTKKDDIFEKILCFHVENCQMIGRLHNFRINVLLPEYPELSYQYQNGSLGKMLTELRDREIDVSAGSTVITKERIDLADFVLQSYELRAVMFAGELSNGILWAGYLYPLHPQVWYALLGCLITAGVVFVILTVMTTSNGTIQPIIPMFTSLQIFCCQSVYNIPRRTSFRLAHFVMMVTAVILLPAYSGTIASLLTIYRRHYPFSTLEDFVRDGRYRITIRRNHFLDSLMLFEHLLPTNSNLILPNWQKSSNEQQGFHQICQGRFVYAVEEETYRPFLHKYDCTIIQLPITIIKEVLALTTPKMSPLSHVLAVGTVHIRSCGFTNRLKNMIFLERRLSLQVRKFQAVTLTQTTPIFIFLLLSGLASLLMLLIEITFAKLEVRPQFKKSVSIFPMMPGVGFFKPFQTYRNPSNFYN